MTAFGKRAILLLNLGSPDSTATRDVHRYLMEFLMDKRVIDYPYLFRRILVGGIIVHSAQPNRRRHTRRYGQRKVRP